MQGPEPRDLFTVLYQPRETMRRVLERRDRWAVSLIILAAICSSFNDTDITRLPNVLPDLKPLPFLAIVVIGLLFGALLWVCALFIFSWIATPVGRMLGGKGTFGDVRAALAWGTVPVIWSAIYRLPVEIFASRFNLVEDPKTTKALLDVIAQGGCAFGVLIVALQIMLFIWTLIVASCTVAEAQRFSTQKGFFTVAIVLVLPLVVTFAAVFSFLR